MPRQETIAEATAAEERLAQKLGAYKGRWVAVRNHEVVRDAPSLETLHRSLGDLAVEAVFQVPKHNYPFFGQAS